jgi:hypothetical protein
VKGKRESNHELLEFHENDRKYMDTERHRKKEDSVMKEKGENENNRVKTKEPCLFCMRKIRESYL